MGGRGGSSGSGAGGTGNVYKSADKTLYTSKNETLYVERLLGTSQESVLTAKTDGNGNLTLTNADYNGIYEQNSKTKYATYELKTGITNASDLHKAKDYDNPKESKYSKENEVVFEGKRSTSRVRSVGIDWENVKSVSGDTYNVKDLIKDKGFKWDGSKKRWVK